MPEGFTFESSFDGIRFDVVSSSVSHGRSVAPHTFPKRDGADLEDGGRNPFVCNLEFIFIDNGRDEADGRGNYETRWREFDSLVDNGSARILIHPYVGSVICRVSDFSHSAGADGQPVISASATFTEEISLPPVFVAGAGSQTRAGFQEVNSSGVATDSALEDAGLSSDITAEATATALTWESDKTLSSRQVLLEMSTLNNRLDAELDSFDARTDISKFPILKQYTLLQHNLRKAATSFASTTTRIVEITVVEPLPLRVIASRFYSAAESERRFSELRDLNPSVKNPTLIPAGTILKAYSRQTDPGRLVQ